MNREYYVLQPDGSPGDGPFAEEEILDLTAFLRSGGKAEHEFFKADAKADGGK